MVLRSIIFGFLLIGLLGITPLAQADNTAHVENATRPIAAILPLANFSVDPSSSALITPLIQQHLSQNGFAIADSAEVWSVLRKYRIRTAFGISLDEMRQLGSALDITYIVLGAVDIYNDNHPPEFGISLRLVRINDGAVVWAASRGATGNDYMAVLGLHKIDSIAVLAQRVLTDMFAAVTPPALETPPTDPGKPAVAVIEFNGPEPGDYGGVIFAAHILNELFAQGFRVIEPGILRATYRRFERFPRGEIDLELLRNLYDSLGVSYAITGSVDVFYKSLAGAENSFPRIVLGARSLDANTGRIISSCELETDGRRLTIFGTGNVHAMEKVAADAARQTIEKLDFNKLQGM